MEQAIFLLKFYTYEGELVYPMELREERVGYYTSLKKAEDIINNFRNISDYKDYYEIEEDDEEEQTYISHFEITEIALDVIYRGSDTTRIYNSLGNYHDGCLIPSKTPFRGIDLPTKYSAGDIVEFIYCNTLYAVIVTGTPWSKEQFLKHENYLRSKHRCLPEEILEESFKSYMEEAYTYGIENVYCVIWPDEEYWEHSHPHQYKLLPIRGIIPDEMEERFNKKIESYEKEKK
ncbi:hypothetical protein EW093_01380 [Thiospirochaeta perfilievii]|uniref:Uncharacterized protein n=1 Tax=Thiospirochaeta perfilievii TaxID=252967 RepID=A0A5C1Q7W4_9SPIO|nr:hypothetical protein [Thiospirochaeta perfilievii]QEN03408.1 hypothetical protein EW093_01380 [Thiospirochaeta perfilievii]